MSERILVVDDEKSVCEILTRALSQLGFVCQAAPSADAAMHLLLDGNKIDLVLSGIVMPGHDGVWLLHEVLEKLPDTAVIMVAGSGDVETAIHCLAEGADNYLIKPVDLVGLPHACQRALERRRLLRENREYQEELERKVEERATGQLRAALEELGRVHQMVKEAHQETIHRLAAAAEFKDDDTAAHLWRISNYSATVARHLGMPEDEANLLKDASPMHDVGKIGIPDSILLKPGPLTAEEFEIVKRHCEIGASILSQSSAELLRMGETVAIAHHERWDGNGYPLGLRGSDIPLVGRIVALADAFDAVTSKRCYKESILLEEAFKIIRNGSKKHFDPGVVEAFLGSTEEVRAIYEGAISEQL